MLGWIVRALVLGEPEKLSERIVLECEVHGKSLKTNLCKFFMDVPRKQGKTQNCNFWVSSEHLINDVTGVCLDLDSGGPEIVVCLFLQNQLNSEKFLDVSFGVQVTRPGAYSSCSASIWVLGILHVGLSCSCEPGGICCPKNLLSDVPCVTAGFWAFLLFWLIWRILFLYHSFP